MKLWKRLTAAVTACSMMLGVAAVRQEGFLSLTAYEASTKPDFWSEELSYETVSESNWDDTLQQVVDKEYITINGATLSCFGPPTYEEFAKYNSEYKIIEIPEKIGGIPVEELTSNDVEYSISNHFENYPRGGAHWILPSTLTSVGSLSRGEYNEIYTHFDGTCEEFFECYPTTRPIHLICSDATCFCTGSSYYELNGDSDCIYYDGTMAQWQSFAPSFLSDTQVICSDGKLNTPYTPPTSSHYTFSKDGTACFVGNLSSDTETLVIPETEQGYTVTTIDDIACMGLSELYYVSIPNTVKSVGDYAFLKCRNLLNIAIPSSVTSIGDYAFGYWQNSDGSYSKMSTVTIYCEEGSAAHQYAVNNGLNYVLQDDPVVTTTATSAATTTTTTTMTTTPPLGSETEVTYPSTTYPMTYPTTQQPTTPPTTQQTTTQATTYPTTQQTTTQPTTRPTTQQTTPQPTTQPPASSTTRETTSWRETTTTNITTTTTTSSDKIILKVGETADISGRYADCTFASANMSIAAVSGNGVVMGLSAGETYIVVTFVDGSLDVLAVTVTDGAATTTTDASETEKLCGDVTLDGKIDLTDAIILNKYCADVVKLSVPAYANADCTADGNVDTNDSIALLRFLVHIINALPSVE